MQHPAYIGISGGRDLAQVVEHSLVQIGMFGIEPAFAICHLPFRLFAISAIGPQLVN